MHELLQHKYDILASLYWMPCSLKELEEREFCHDWPTWYIVSVLVNLERNGLVKEQKDGIYKAIKTKARKVLNQYGYEIDDY